MHTLEPAIAAPVADSLVLAGCDRASEFVTGPVGRDIIARAGFAAP